MEWLPSWATSIQKTEDRNLPPPLGDKTLRQYVWPTYSGDEVRIQLSNEKGTSPVVISKVHIAMPGQSAGQIDAATDAEFTFEGSASVTIPPGETAWSDALGFPLEELALTAVTMHFTSVPSEITGHPGARTTTFVGAGDTVAAPSLNSPETRERWYFINAIEVMAPRDAFAISVLGDSITDGYGVLDAFARWPDFMTEVIKADPMVANKVSVLNAGMGANSLLNSSAEQDSGVVRFERDVLGRPKVKWLIVLHGVNDIGSQSDTSLVDQVTAAYQDIVDRGHEAGILVYGSPITPFKGNSYDTGQALAIRNGINDWVVSGGVFDAVIRLDEAVADPADKDRLLATFSNDGLHPSIAGYEAMGNAVDTALFYDLFE
jgi:lysophospholipase L1-like esterase